MNDWGLLILRLGIGVIFVYYGAPLIAGGTAMWQKLGSSMSFLGIHWQPVFWGFMAAVAELMGGVCVILGFFFKPACIMLFFTMIVAGASHLGKGEGFRVAAHAFEMATVFLALFFTGAGKYKLKKQ